MDDLYELIGICRPTCMLYTGDRLINIQITHLEEYELNFFHVRNTIKRYIMEYTTDAEHFKSIRNNSSGYIYLVIEGELLKCQVCGIRKFLEGKYELTLITSNIEDGDETANLLRMMI
jgi:hypothetical protein